MFVEFIDRYPTEMKNVLSFFYVYSPVFTERFTWNCRDDDPKRPVLSQVRCTLSTGMMGDVDS